ncbi:hypothetical protein RvY_04877-2 [Ramazzottius varieornatus]|uniref:Uncharacterized protein n=1 Tax=Ramazzottius varieornatus TaxID=947166 RepID=A0A1D1UYS0_RAMVA|nr:hypothetical protein RvY_04877-2 [Ramazzottius varieornatus]
MFKFFLSWNRLRFVCAFGNCPNFSYFFRTCRNVIVCIAFVHLAAQIISISGPFFINVPAYAQLNQRLMEGFDYYDTAMQILNYCGGVLSSVVYIAPCYYFGLVSEALVIEFCHLTNDLARAVEESCTRRVSAMSLCVNWWN